MNLPPAHQPLRRRRREKPCPVIRVLALASFIIKILKSYIMIFMTFALENVRWRAEEEKKKHEKPS